jgi:RHS repeat-associated protein
LGYDDRYGNRWTQTVTAGTGPSSSLTFSNSGGALTNHPDGWCFDASGNLLAKSGNCPPTAPNFVYDGENRLVADPVAGATYVYDGNGTRIQKCLPNCTSPTASTVYVYSGSQDIAEYNNGAVPSSPSLEFIYSDAIPGSGLLASVASGTTTYFHSDHLSWRVSTNASGQIFGQQGNFPFGESWYSSNGNEFMFTSYQRDAESGLDYAMARYYDTTVARFCSADPLGGQVGDPQTWNRYAYSRNDPINMNDPSGQGFWNWFALIGSIAADIYLGGLPSEAATLGTTISQDTAALSTMYESMRVVQTSPMGETQQGQQPQQRNPQGNVPTDTTLRLNCIQLALNKIVPGALFHQKSGSGAQPWGGHMNGTFESAPLSPQTAQQISDSVQAADKGKVLPNLLPGVDHGARFPSDSSAGGSLHLPSGNVEIASDPVHPGSVTVTASGHIDTYNPQSGPGGTLGHGLHDVLWGTIKQKIFHGDLDKWCPGR